MIQGWNDLKRKPELIPPKSWKSPHVRICSCSPTQAMRDMSSVYPSKQSQVYPSCTRTHRPFSHPFSTPHSSARSPSNASYGSVKEREVLTEYINDSLHFRLNYLFKVYNFTHFLVLHNHHRRAACCQEAESHIQGWSRTHELGQQPEHPDHMADGNHQADGYYT